MNHFIHHYVYEDLWQPLWENWVAGIVAAGVAYFWKGKKWLRKHEEHQRKISEIHAHLLGNANVAKRKIK